MREKRNADRISTRNSEGKRPVVLSRSRWEDNTKLNVRETGWGYGLNSSGSGYRPIDGLLLIM
jgi:hypothetical protein